MNVIPPLRIHIPQWTKPMGGEQIVNHMQREIEAGTLPVGGRLPPVRFLAHQLGISKNTVQAAYSELQARGLLETRLRQGVFVAGASENLATPSKGLRPKAPALLGGFRHPDSPKPPNLDLGNVFIDPRLLPLDRLSLCFRSVLQSPGLSPHYDAQGYLPLRQAIAGRLKKRGIGTTAEEIIITTGSQQALDLTCRALSQKRIATENPAYGIGKMLFEMNQMEVIGLPLNPFESLPLDHWESQIRYHRPALLYLTTNFQNPTGYSYSTSELHQIATWSQNYNFGIIEDDWGSDMLSFSEFRPPLRALAGSNILYMNSFTKKLLPSLRIGFLVAPKPLIPTLVSAKRAVTLGNPTLTEMALFEFLDRGYFDSHLNQLQTQLDRRYHHCLKRLNQWMPDGIRWAKPGGGPLIWLECPSQLDLGRLALKVRDRGVGIRLSGNRFFGKPHLHGFPLGYAWLDRRELDQALKILTSVITEEC